MSNYVESAYQFGKDESRRNEIDWDKGTWYFAPDKTVVDNVFWNGKVIDGIDICALSLPFTSEAHLNAGYTNEKDEGSYIGLAKSAILCTHPLDFNDYYIGPV